MAGSTTSIETQTHYEDVLAHLPASKTTAYDKGQMIYDLDRHPRSIYLVVNGAVGISHRAENGADVLLDIVRTDELFGESAFLEVQCPSERASAIEKAELMNWTVSERCCRFSPSATPSILAGSRALRLTASNGGSPAPSSASPSGSGSRSKADPCG